MPSHSVAIIAIAAINAAASALLLLLLIVISFIYTYIVTRAANVMAAHMHTRINANRIECAEEMIAGEKPIQKIL